jgi:hypothetical protein
MNTYCLAKRINHSRRELSSAESQIQSRVGDVVDRARGSEPKKDRCSRWFSFPRLDQNLRCGVL